MNLDKVLADAAERFAVPGAAVGVIGRDAQSQHAACGLRDVEAGRPFTASTLTPIASVTKSFTAALAANLVDGGVLSWDAPIREAVPGFTLSDPYVAQRVTLRDMLAHRTGLPRHDGVWFGQDLQPGDLLGRIAHLPLSRDLRQEFQYCNLIYDSVGQICAQLCGADFDDLVVERICRPLGLTGCQFGVPADAADAALPYARADGRYAQVPYEDDGPAQRPAGGLVCHIGDLVCWLEFHLGSQPAPSVLSPAALKELHEPQALTTEGNVFPEVHTYAYGLGWHVGSYRGCRLVHHAGDAAGFSAQVMMLPDQGLGVAVLANMSRTRMCDAVACTVLDHLLGAEPLPWLSRFAELEKQETQGPRNLTARRPSVPGTRPSHDLADYAGVYRHPGYGIIEIHAGDGALYGSRGQLHLRFTHRHFDVFDMQIEHLAFGVSDLRFPVQFQTSADGRIVSLTAGLEPAVPPVEFERDAAARPPSADQTQRLAGQYTAGPMSLTIETAAHGSLVATVTGRPSLTLDWDHDLIFTAPEMPGISIEFIIGADGRPREVAVDPVGVFTAGAGT